MATIDSFLPLVMIEVPQCPEPVATAAIRSALIQLCDEALIWQEVVDPFVTEDGEAEYDIDAPSGARTSTIIRVELDGRHIAPKNEDRLAMRSYDFLSRKHKPVSYYQPNPDVIRFYPVPDGQYTVNMTLSYAPKRTGNSVPDYIFEQYLEVVKCGALFRLMTQPAKPWTQPNLGMKYGQMFSYGIDSARTEINKGRTRANLLVTQRPFA